MSIVAHGPLVKIRDLKIILCLYMGCTCIFFILILFIAMGIVLNLVLLPAFYWGKFLQTAWNKTKNVTAVSCGRYFLSVDSLNSLVSEIADVLVPLDPFNRERDEIMLCNNNLNTKQWVFGCVHGFSRDFVCGYLIWRFVEEEYLLM